MNGANPRNKTEKMIEEVNSFFATIGEAPLAVPSGPGISEIELLRCGREEYTRRLLKKKPLYRMLPPALIPDLFLQALRNREDELKK